MKDQTKKLKATKKKKKEKEVYTLKSTFFGTIIPCQVPYLSSTFTNICNKKDIVEYITPNY